jgi:hypothetical protein
LAIGCNDYDYVTQLTGANKDADSIFDTLTDTKYGDYDKNGSILLKSPLLEDVRKSLEKVLFDKKDIDVFTFYFSGHGGINNGNYYLYIKDSDPSKSSISCLSLSVLFALINEVKPSQTNIIIDACNSAGVIEDLGNLLKPEILGKKNTPAITIFVMSSSDQSSFDTSEGAVATNEFLKYLNGQICVHTRPYLDLVEIARHIKLDSQASEQIPNVWGLNLYGESLFTKNPNYTGGSLAFSQALINLPAQSEIGKIVQDHSGKLWNLQQGVSTVIKPREIFNEWQMVCDKLPKEGGYIDSFIKGILNTFRAEAQKNNDIFSDTILLATSISTLLKYSTDETVTKTIDDLIKEYLDKTYDTLVILKNDILKDKFGLLSSSGGGLGDFYYLPLRISKVLGWMGSIIIIKHILNLNKDNEIVIFKDILKLILSEYSKNIVSVSDEQSPYILLFLLASKIIDEKESAELVIGYMFSDYVSSKGSIAVSELAPEKVLDFLIKRYSNAYDSSPEMFSMPDELLAVILYGGNLFESEDLMDPYLEQLDYHNFNLYLPGDYKDFASPVMTEGVNLTYRIGFGIWTIKDFAELFDKDSIKSFENIDERSKITSIIAFI